MVQNTICDEAGTSFNGEPSHRKRQEFSSGVEAEIGSGVLAVQRPFVRGSRRFSLFKWFKRGNRDSTSIGKRRRRVSSKINIDEQNPSSSSTESIDTFCSTTTVRSFAFHNGAFHRCNNGLHFDFLRQLPDVGPFGAGAVKLLEKGNNSDLTNVTYTLPNTFSRKRDIAERYSLQPSNSFNSCGNIPIPVDKSNSSLKGKKVHVKGKRRAPNPPDFKSNTYSTTTATTSTSTSISTATTTTTTVATSTTITTNVGQVMIKTGKRRRRPAPRPPEKSNLKTEKSTSMQCGTRPDLGTCPIISTDTLILRGGVLLPKKENKSASECTRKSFNNNLGGGTSSGIVVSRVKESQSHCLDPTSTINRAMPRPWYKRSVFDNSRDTGTAKRGDVLRNSSTIDKREESGPSTSAISAFSFESSLSRLNFFHRSERNSEDRRREAKRKSGISILTNISELDKEAAAIVQEEQARARAATLLQNIRFIDLEDKIAINEQLVQNMVASTIESSPKRSTRALISKFNAISNLTKVNVNSNFFTSNSSTGESNKFDMKSQIRGHQTKTDWMNGEQNIKERQSLQHERDLSRYFLPHQRSHKLKSNFNEIEKEFTESDNHIEKIKRPSANENTSASTDIPGTKANKNEKLSSFNKLPLVNGFESKTEPSSSFKADRTEKILTENLRSKQKKDSDDNRTPDNENTSKYAFPPKVSESCDNNKVFTQEKSDSLSMSKKLDMIFDDIDKQLQSNKTRSKDKDSKTEAEADTSNQVTKILDFLIESEKASKEKSYLAGLTADKASSKKETSELISFENKQMSSKGKPTVLNTEDDTVITDLKEMLKEMKHSLPKRSKTKKALNEPEITNINNKPSTSAFRDQSEIYTYLNKNDSDKSEIVLPTRTKLERLRDGEKQKVSSGVQTIGNLRKVNNLPMKREIIYTAAKTNEQNNAPKLIKNTFHLIRPKDFAEIEAIKIVTKSCQENTYANVIEQSLYANAMVPPQKSTLNTQSCGSMIRDDQVKINNHLVSYELNQKEKLKDHVDEFKKQNMNTLAVNKLLKKLEAAIASGNHQQAAMLAKELAQLKIHCSVVRQRAANAKAILNVNMYIEDKEAHQGPIPLMLSTNMTVAQLKAKIYVEFEIPTNIQRWIIGKNLADNDDSSLEELQATEGSPLFLYLVAPDLNQDDVAQAEKINIVEKIKKENIQEVNLEVKVKVKEERLEIAENVNPLKQAEVKDHTAEENKLDRYEELISLENFDVVPNSEPIECPICFITYGSQEGITLRDCLHAFCRPCIANTILYCEEAEVKCPYTDSEYTCESKLQEREIKALVAPNVYQQHLAKSIAQAENAAGNNAFHCKTPDCFGWCIYDDNVNNFLCPVCHANNCLTCQVIHTGKNCRQYQEELRLSKETDQESKRTAAMLAEMVDRGEALPCPTCAVVLMKKWGCDWLRCTMCKTEICWVTKGPRWGPGGKGDTSGGCKCGENGVKCHPRCNYCH